MLLIPEVSVLVSLELVEFPPTPESPIVSFPSQSLSEKVPEVSVLVPLELVAFLPTPESPFGSSPSQSSPPSSEAPVAVEFPSEEDSCESSLQSSPESSPAVCPPGVLLTLLLLDGVALPATLVGEPATEVGVEPLLPPELLGLLVGVLVVPETEAAPLDPFPAPVNPPLAPEALMRANASCSVSQAILVPFELTRGSAKHERPLEH